MADFNKKIKILRKECGFTQKELSDYSTDELMREVLKRWQ